jgi:hypothetical protein
MSSRGTKRKRKAVDPPPQDDLDLEIENLEAIHQQVDKRQENMLQISQLQRQIDEISEELHHMTQQGEQF